MSLTQETKARQRSNNSNSHSACMTLEVKPPTTLHKGAAVSHANHRPVLNIPPRFGYRLKRRLLFGSTLRQHTISSWDRFCGRLCPFYNLVWSGSLSSWSPKIRFTHCHRIRIHNVSSWWQSSVIVTGMNKETKEVIVIDRQRKKFAQPTWEWGA